MTELNDNNILLEIKNIKECIKILVVNQIGKDKNNQYSDENKFPIRKKDESEYEYLIRLSRYRHYLEYNINSHLFKYFNLGN